MDDSTPLIDTLTLEPIERNLFRGRSPSDNGRRIFGGLVIAQALMAAYETVQDRLCHSLHAYFIRPGDAFAPVLYQVDQARDGRSFTTRRVTAIQHGEQIFNLAASFQTAEEGFQHQAPAPLGLPGPDECSDRWGARVDELKAQGLDPQLIARMERPRPIEMRTVGGYEADRPVGGPARQTAWFRARDPIPADPRMQQVVLAYASDMSLLSTAWVPHNLSWDTPGLQQASLDHAIWFHHPVSFNDWHLYDQESPWAGGARGFIRGAMYTQDGKLIASVAQEGLMRYREPDPSVI